MLKTITRFYISQIFALLEFPTQSRRTNPDAGSQVRFAPNHSGESKFNQNCPQNASPVQRCTGEAFEFILNSHGLNVIQPIKFGCFLSRQLRTFTHISKIKPTWLLEQ